MKIKQFISITVVSLYTTFALAADLDKGQSLYEENCTKCHDSSVFTRKDRKVNDLDALKKQVRMCASSLENSWLDEDEENVTAYLSDAYYKFKL